MAYDSSPLISAKRKLSSVITLVLAILVFGGGGIAMCIAAFRDEYPDLPLLLVSIFLIGIAAGCLANVLMQDRMEVYDDRLEIYSLRGRLKRTILLHNITAWSEYTSSKNGPWLTLHGDGDDYTIAADDYKKYEELKAWLTKGKEQAAAAMPRRTKIILNLMCGLMMTAGVLMAGYGIMQAKAAPEDSAIPMTTIADVIVNEPEVTHTHGKNATSYIEIRLGSCPEFRFRINEHTLKATDTRAYTATVRTGDSLFVTIPTDIYKKKISKELPMGFFEKTVGYRSIDVYGLYSRQGVYLPEADYYHETNSSRLTFIIIGIVMLLLGLLLLKFSSRLQPLKLQRF